MVIENTGDIFGSGCDLIGIPVNLVGVMGAGLAKAFKNRYPKGVEEYRKSIATHALDRNKCCVLVEDGMAFLMVPTKYHWKEDSNLDDIRKTLHNLHHDYDSDTSISIALPALGCGCGKLGYDDVKKVVIDEFGADPKFIIHLYKPHGKR